MVTQFGYWTDGNLGLNMNIAKQLHCIITLLDYFYIWWSSNTTFGHAGWKPKRLFKTASMGTSLVVQWLRIHLPMQGTRVRALVWEDPTCCRATKPMSHNYWACALEPTSHNYWARMPQLLKPTCVEPMLRNKRSHPNEKPMHRNGE